MFLAIEDQIGNSGHGAVCLHDFADHPTWRESGEAGQIHGSFGLTGANQHAALTGTQWEHMSWSGQIGRTGIGTHGYLNRKGAVRRRNTRSDALSCVNRFAECRAEL